MFTVILQALLGLVIGYIFGSFPTGYFAGRMYGVDVRRHGSGRTGGTNVLRSAGWIAFVLTVIGDVLKGMLPVLLLKWLYPSSEIPAAFALVGALLGHNWSVFIALLAKRSAIQPSTAYGYVKEFFSKAKGGAGVATTGAAALVLFWPAVLPLAVVGIALVLIFHYSSVSSITVAALFPLVMAFFVFIGAAPLVYLIVGIIASAILLYVHIPNMKRLRAGTEQRFGQRLASKRTSERTPR